MSDRAEIKQLIFQVISTLILTFLRTIHFGRAFYVHHLSWLARFCSVFLRPGLGGRTFYLDARWHCCRMKLEGGDENSRRLSLSCSRDRTYQQLYTQSVSLCGPYLLSDHVGETVKTFSGGISRVINR